MSAGTKKLSGKVAVVTGGSKGIGAEIARALGREGASVIVNYASSRAGAEAVVAEIEKAGGRAFAIQADVSTQADIVRLFAETKKAFGRVDVLVNNAGIYDFAPLENVTPEFFRKQFDLNVLGLLLTTQEAVKHFDSTGGSVINISSLISRLGLPGASVYAATKAAVDSITRTLASELGPRRIRVNSINPGMVITEGSQHLSGDPESQFRKSIESQTPLGRIGQVDDIAPAVVYFASDDSKWITGESLFIAGGYR